MFLADVLEEPLQGITLLYGPAGTGKTTVCLHELRGRTVYISTNKNFNVSRLQTMRTDAAEIISRLVLFEPSDLLTLEKAVDTAVRLSSMSDLIVVDSVATFVRASDRKMGNLALNRILTQLRKADCPVLLTTEVYERAEGMHNVQFVGGDMLRLAADTIVELHNNVLTVKKHKLHTNRQRDYKIADSGLEKV